MPDDWYRVQGRVGPARDLKLRVHDPASCEGRPCPIHHPSDHHMVDWPLNWRADRRLMERICPHGVGHPDPDHMTFARAGEPHSKFYDDCGVHGCDGCCDPRGHQWFTKEELPCLNPLA